MRRRLLSAVAAVALVVTAALALAGAPPRLLVTTGISMQPDYSAGDLAVLRPAREYGVGDVAAYRSATLEGAVVLHRIVDVRPDDSFTLQGDNNSWLDPDHPTRADMVGRLVLHVPRGGVWLRRLTDPTVVGVLAFSLIAVGGAAVQTRRSRRRRRTPVPSPRPLQALPSALRTTAAVAAAASVLGASLGVLSLSGPAGAVMTRTETSDRSMSFGYAADVRPSSVYDRPRAQAPLPVFRKLGERVEVHVVYRGEPATVRVDARLSASNGWSVVVPLTDPVQTRGERHDEVVWLDLRALDRRLAAVSRDTGVPSDSMRVEVVPTVALDGREWSPALAFDLTPLQLRLAEGPESLMVQDIGTSTRTVAAPRTLRLLGVALPSVLVRAVAGLLLLVGAGAALAVVAGARRAAQGSEADVIRRRWSELLVPVQPMPLPLGRPVIDVTGFPTLVRLAERYGLLVLHWERSGVETFVLQDEGTTYRYRTGTEVTGEVAVELASV